MLVAAMAIISAVLPTSCVKDTLYDTIHPDYGKISVTADWTARGEGIPVPATWTVNIGDYTATETTDTHVPDHLFIPGTYTLAAWNTAQGTTVNGTTLTVDAVAGNWSDAGNFIENNPDWSFVAIQQIQIEKDKDQYYIAAMQQQMRELTLVIEPTGDAAAHIEEIVAYLTGAAGTLDFATGTYGAASNVALPFTKITDGADAGKWTATVRMLGIAGSEQTLKGEIRYTAGNPQPTTLDSNLTSDLSRFNAGDKTRPLVLGGTLVETPKAVGISNIEINDWELADGGDVSAEM